MHLLVVIHEPAIKEAVSAIHRLGISFYKS